MTTSKTVLRGVTIMWFVSVGAALSAQEPSDGRLAVNTEKVIVFKDGYCLVIKRAKGVTDQSGRVYLAEVPESAVLGSFWATAKETRIQSMVAGWVETTEETTKELPCVEMLELLEANKGRPCTIEMVTDNSVQGTIGGVLAKPSATGLSSEDQALLFPVALSSGAGVREQIQSRTIESLAGRHVIIETQTGDVVLPAADIRRLTIPNMQRTFKKKVTTRKRTKRLTFQFAEPNREQEIVLMYFRPGVRWVPTYRINLTKDDAGAKIAEIDMQAEIINEAEDLIDMKMDIVVGVPNFRFRNAISPLSLEQTLRRTMRQEAQTLNMNNGFAQNYISNNFLGNSGQGIRQPANPIPTTAASPASVELPAELTATGSQDLFVYNLPTLQIKKGERTAVHILSTKIPYRDIYTWDIHLRRADIAAAPSGKGVQSPLQLGQNTVWRQVQLVNTTKIPWTAGAAMIMDGEQPLAQELLTYTSPGGGVCRLPVTISVDLRGRFTEEEVSRNLNALDWDRSRYAKIDQRATLDLQNRKQETVEVEVTCRFGGAAQKVSDDGEISLAPFSSSDWTDYRGAPAVNNSSTVRWTQKIEPGKTFKPTIDYFFYTRN